MRYLVKRRYNIIDGLVFGFLCTAIALDWWPWWAIVLLIIGGAVVSVVAEERWA